MSEKDTSEGSLLTDSRLRLAYVVGIALNLVALYGAATAGEWLFAVTFGVIILYLLVRYRMTAGPGF